MRVERRREREMSTTVERVVRQSLPAGTSLVVQRELDSFDETVQALDFVARLFVVFGAIGLGLAAVGLYSLLAFVVAQRRREFAVRLALGATGGQVARAVLHDAAVMVLAGTGIGAFLAMWLARALDSLLYGVFYTDAAALVAAEAMVLAVAFAACAVPSRRAARAEPARYCARFEPGGALPSRAQPSRRTMWQ